MPADRQDVRLLKDARDAPGAQEGVGVLQYMDSKLEGHARNVQSALDSLVDLYNARLAAQELLNNTRFDDSQVAVQAALIAQEKAVNAAFLAQQTAMQTALTAQKLAVDTAQAAADRAVTKSELAADKRFEGVNEFRKTLSDQQQLFMPRTEVQTIENALHADIERVADGLNKEIQLTRSNEAIVSTTYLTRTEAKATFDAAVGERASMTGRINALEQANANLQGRMWAIGVGLTIFTVATSIALHFIH